MEILDAIRANLLSPAVLFFALGLIAALTKSDLKFPEPFYVGLTIYLLVAIGFKGGVAIAEAGLARVWLPALAAMALGTLIHCGRIRCCASEGNFPPWTLPPSRRIMVRLAQSHSSRRRIISSQSTSLTRVTRQRFSP